MDIRDGFPDLPESFSDNYDYTSDNDFDVDDEEAKPVKLEEPRAAAKETRSEEGISAILDSEKYGYILRFEKEDAQSEASVSEMESALADFEDIKCVREPLGPSTFRHSQHWFLATAWPTTDAWLRRS